MTNWQRTYFVRTTVEQNSRQLSEALATNDINKVMASLNQFETSIKELKLMYDFKSISIERTTCDTCAPGTEENRNTYEPII